MSFSDESIRNVGERDSSKPFSPTSSEHSPQPLNGIDGMIRLTTAIILSTPEIEGVSSESTEERLGIPNTLESGDDK
ncbi:hypothetical protein TNCV_3240511 [Trichonephila clavipes]|nr:hypothetical protein TNCV_3240511 [Trichonephila clavipes]